jgi:hypothetical protein
MSRGWFGGTAEDQLGRQGQGVKASLRPVSEDGEQLEAEEEELKVVVESEPQEKEATEAETE